MYYTHAIKADHNHSYWRRAIRIFFWYFLASNWGKICISLICMRRLRLSGIQKNKKKIRVEEQELPKPMFVMVLEEHDWDIIADSR